MRRKQHKFNNSPAVAFTLVELLVTLAILTALLVSVAQMVNTTSSVTSGSGRRLDADAQARVVFERMATDFGNMLKRADVDTFFYKAAGNDKIFFFSQAPAYYDSAVAAGVKSGAALVGYRVTDGNGDMANYAPAYSLERLGKGLVWSGTSNGTNAVPGSVVFHSGTATATNTLLQNWATEIGSAPYTGGVSDCYHAIGDQVFRMEICFQVKHLTSASQDGVVYSNYPVAMSNATTVQAGAPSGTAADGARWYDTTASRAYVYTGGAWQPNGLEDVISIVVTICILDNSSRKIAGNADLSQLIAQIFSDPTNADLSATPAQLPPQIWKTKLEASLQSDASAFRAACQVPKAAATQIRIYQRHFYLNNLAP